MSHLPTLIKKMPSQTFSIHLPHSRNKDRFPNYSQLPVGISICIKVRDNALWITAIMKSPTVVCQERWRPNYCVTFHSVMSRTLMRAANSIHHIHKSCAIRQCGIVGKSGEPFWGFHFCLSLWKLSAASRITSNRVRGERNLIGIEKSFPLLLLWFD